jgi:hypothetical protein
MLRVDSAARLAARQAGKIGIFHAPARATPSERHSRRALAD